MGFNSGFKGLNIKHICNININQSRNKKSLKALQRSWIQGSKKKGKVQLGEQEKLWAERIIKKFPEDTLQRSGE